MGGLLQEMLDSDIVSMDAALCSIYDIAWNGVVDMGIGNFVG